jgi:hypothetical protein
MHIGRGPEEATDPDLAAFYDRLLACLDQPAFRDGEWRLLGVRSAWDGNASSDNFICYGWTGPGDERRLVAVNYSDQSSQCYVEMPWPDLAGSTWRLVDIFGEESYERRGDDLAQGGLYLDLQAWAFNVFEVRRAALAENA